jgi:hypothetical protein
MKFVKHSVSPIVNLRELLRLLELSDTRGEDFVIEKENLSELHNIIEMLLETYIQPPFAHPER